MHITSTSRNCFQLRSIAFNCSHIESGGKVAHQSYVLPVLLIRSIAQIIVRTFARVTTFLQCYEHRHHAAMATMMKVVDVVARAHSQGGFAATNRRLVLLSLQLLLLLWLLLDTTSRERLCSSKASTLAALLLRLLLSCRARARFQLQPQHGQPIGGGREEGRQSAITTRASRLGFSYDVDSLKVATAGQMGIPMAIADPQLKSSSLTDFELVCHVCLALQTPSDNKRNSWRCIDASCDEHLC